MVSRRDSSVAGWGWPPPRPGSGLREGDGRLAVRLVIRGSTQSSSGRGRRVLRFLRVPLLAGATTIFTDVTLRVKLRSSDLRRGCGAALGPGATLERAAVVGFGRLERTGTMAGSRAAADLLVLRAGPKGVGEPSTGLGL